MASKMTDFDAIKISDRLNRKYGVFTGSLMEILNQVRDAIRHDLCHPHPRATKGWFTETRADAIRCGHALTTLRERIQVNAQATNTHSLDV